MNTSATTGYGSAPYSQQVEIDDICDRFEAEFKANRQPRAEDFIGRADPQARPTLVCELLKLELDYRRDEAEAVREEYELRFPELLDVIRRTLVASDAPLDPGTMWGGFRIQRHIGAGGMGVVYEAYDTRLERTVALKFVTSKFAQDHQRLTRFEGEAKILAGLNHPNIATLHNLEEYEGIRFLVLEFVPGQTLAQMIRHRRFSLGELISVFAQIAQALESAHDAGVIHRDLKPANVKITADGNVKVLDFGLASSTSVSGNANENNLANSFEPTAWAHHVTRDPSQNVALSGTLSYMSPEQAQGKTVDKRCDIWAFGCCLYETLTREKAFPEETPERVLHAICEREPDWTLLPSDFPSSLVRLLQRCMTKDSRQRLRDIGDARIELEQCRTELSTRSGAPQEHGTNKPMTMRLFSLALLTVLITGLGIIGLVRPKFEEVVNTSEARVTVPLPANVELGDAPALALSPDGSCLVFVAAGEDAKRRLFIRQVNEFDPAKMLAGTEDAAQPFFSPDGQTIGFFADNGLKTVSVSGGRPILVCDARHPSGACWSTGGRIIFGWNWGRALDSISPDGSDRKNLARLGVAYVYYWPQLLHDGKTLVFGSDKVMMADLEQLERTMAEDEPAQHTVIIRHGSFARYVKGHLLYGYRGTLHAVPFKLDPPRLNGTRKAVAGDLWTAAHGAAQFAVSKSDIAYVAGKAMEEGQLVWKSRQTDDPPEPVWSGYRVYESLRLSPDGKKLAIGVLGAEGWDVWIYDFKTKTESILDATSQNQRPIWFHDGKRVVMLSARDNQRGLFMKELGVNRPPTLLLRSPFRQTPVCLSKDERKLIYYRTNADSGSDVLEFDFETQISRPLLATNEDEAQGCLSPDEHWLVFATTGATRDTQIFVCRYPPEEDTPIRISTKTGGLDPMWSPTDDNEIFYLSGDGHYLMSAKVTRDPFEFVKSEPIFSTRDFINVPGFSYDYDPHADRFLLVQRRGDADLKTEIRLILNWAD